MIAMAPWPPRTTADWWLLLLQVGLVASVALAGLALAYGLATA